MNRRAILRRNSWPVPPIFTWLQKLGEVEPAEMDQVFNLGVGLALGVSLSSLGCAFPKQHNLPPAAQLMEPGPGVGGPGPGVLPPTLPPQVIPVSMPSVQALGDALSNPTLRGSTFVVAGHTDGVGGEQFNQELSERRADTIKHYLVDHYHIASGDLVTVGYGKTKLKNAADPSE